MHETICISVTAWYGAISRGPPWPLRHLLASKAQQSRMNVDQKFQAAKDAGRQSFSLGTWNASRERRP